MQSSVYFRFSSFNVLTMKLLLDMLKSTLFRKKDFHITFLHLLDQIVAVKHRKKDKFYIHTKTLLQSFICRIKPSNEMLAEIEGKVKAEFYALKMPFENIHWICSWESVQEFFDIVSKVFFLTICGSYIISCFRTCFYLS